MMFSRFQKEKIEQLVVIVVAERCG